MNTFKKVKAITLLNSITLEATEAATQAVEDRVIVNTYESDQLNIICKYTTGAAETSNNAYVKIWGYIGQFSTSNNFPYENIADDTTNTDMANDESNWIQIGTHDISSGTATFTASLFKIAGASAATTYDAQFALGITFPKIRVSAYEDGVASAKGSLTAVALIQ